MQVDPIKLELKAPETAKTNHLTLKRDGLLSTVAFKINLRRYTMGPAIMVLFIVFGGYYVNADNVPTAFKWINKVSRRSFNRCIPCYTRLDLVLEKCNMMNCFQTLLSVSTCGATTRPRSSSGRSRQGLTLVPISA